VYNKGVGRVRKVDKNLSIFLALCQKKPFIPRFGEEKGGV